MEGCWCVRMLAFSGAYIAESAPSWGGDAVGQESEGKGRQRGTPAVFLGAGLPPGEEKLWRANLVGLEALCRHHRSGLKPSD